MVSPLSTSAATATLTKANPVRRLLEAAPMLAVLVGAVLRVRQLVEVRSLWMDEAMLAVNIVERPLSGLAAPLELNQGAPLGFLVLQKLATLALGSSDLVLRLLPFVASIAALALFARVATNWIGRAGLLAVLWMALSTPLVDYATEAKQYSSDVFVAVLLLWVTRPWVARRANDRDHMVLAVVGAASLWLSHPASFALPGIGIVVAAQALRPFSRRGLLQAAMVAAAWGISAILLYEFSLASLAANTALLNYWKDYFLPLHGGGAGTWLVWALRAFVQDTAGLVPAEPVLAVAAIGLVSLAWRRPAMAVLALMPIVVALAASAAELYPFGHRLLLFATPGLFLLAAEGVGCVATAAARASSLVAPRLASPVAGLVGLALGLMLLVQPARAAWERMAHPRVVEHLRPGLEYLVAHRLPGDGVYVYYGAKPAFRFYSKSLPLDGEGLVLGRAHRSDPDAYLPEVGSLVDRARVWLVYSHDCPSCTFNEKELLIDAFERERRRVDAVELPGAAVYLFSRDAK